jgi:putative flippase GtrA
MVLVRHQVGALIATALDFATMILLVELCSLTPVVATAAGAAIGGTSNFLLGRAWVFRRTKNPWAGQAARYALVSGASAGWNVVGEHLMHDTILVPYVAARVVVSIAVSLLWNFPAQRWFVFRERAAR